MGEVIHVTKARIVKEPGKGMKTGYLDAFPDDSDSLRHPRGHQELLQGRTRSGAGPPRWITWPPRSPAD